MNFKPGRKNIIPALLTFLIFGTIFGILNVPIVHCYPSPCPVDYPVDYTSAIISGIFVGLLGFVLSYSIFSIINIKFGFLGKLLEYSTDWKFLSIYLFTIFLLFSFTLHVIDREVNLGVVSVIYGFIAFGSSLIFPAGSIIGRGIELIIISVIVYILLFSLLFYISKKKSYYKQLAYGLFVVLTYMLISVLVLLLK